MIKKFIHSKQIKKPSLLLFYFLFAFVFSELSLQAQIFLRIPDEYLIVTEITQIDNAIWLRTGKGVYRIMESGPEHIFDKDLIVYNVIKIDNAVWLSTNKGAYRIIEGEPERIIDEDIEVYDIIKIDNAVWLGTNKGAYRIIDGEPEHFFDKDLLVLDIIKIDNAVWLGTDKGAYRIMGSGPEHIFDKDLIVYDIIKIDNAVWLSTEKGAYRIIEGEIERIFDEDIEVYDIIKIDNAFWLRTEIGAYQIIEGESELIPNVYTEVYEITEIDNVVWLGTDIGAYRIIDGEPEDIFDEDLIVYNITKIDNAVWLGTDKGAYRIIEDEPELIFNIDIEVYEIIKIDNTIWLGTEVGAFTIHLNESIQVNIQNEVSWWKDVLTSFIPGNIWLSGYANLEIQYTGDLNSILEKNKINESFEIIISSDSEEFNNAVLDENEYGLEKNAGVILDQGHSKIFYKVKDKWENTKTGTIEGYVVPDVWSLPIFILLFWVIVISIIVLLAPFVIFFHNLLMNPWLRKIGSFGLIPLILTVFPFVRRHLLRRYLKTLNDDEEFAIWKEQYIIPAEEFLPEKFGYMIKKNRMFYLIGESGIGKTSYFRYLTWCYTSSTKNKLIPKKTVPIFIPIGRYQKTEPVKMFHAQLKKYGMLVDDSFTRWYLEQGGFFIFIDGLNEVDNELVNRVNSFIDENWKKNYFCISSQTKYHEFDHIKAEKMVGFSKEEINDLVKKRLGNENGEKAREQFTEIIYEICRLPQNCEFIIELYKSGLTLPTSLSDLYEKVLASTFSEWEKNGRTDYINLLYDRAYSMLCTKDQFFEGEKSKLPSEIREDLLSKKFIIKRDNNYLFRHDKIRAFLAAKHLLSNWNKLLGGKDLNIDSNWRPMMEFVISEISLDKSITNSSIRAKELLFKLLQNNSEFALDLFKWMKENYSDLCKDWETEFGNKYGEMKLQLA